MNEFESEHLKERNQNLKNIITIDLNKKSEHSIPFCPF